MHCCGRLPWRSLAWLCGGCAVRFGYEKKIQGRIGQNWLHFNCIEADGRTLPTLTTLSSLQGWETLGEAAKSEARALATDLPLLSGSDEEADQDGDCIVELS